MSEMEAGEGQKRAKFWGVLRRVVWRRVVQKNLNQQQPQQQQPQPQHHQKWRVEAKPRISVGSPFPGFRVWVWAFWVQKIWPKH